MMFNEKLIKLRKAKGWSQEELGEFLNVTRQTISKWELGQTTPEMDKLIEISKIFDVSIDELTKGKTNIIKEKDKKIIWIVISIVLICGFVFGTYKIVKTNKKKQNEKEIIEITNNIVQHIDDTMDRTKEKIINNQNQTLEYSQNQYSEINEKQEKILDDMQEIQQEMIQNGSEQQKELLEKAQQKQQQMLQNIY